MKKTIQTHSISFIHAFNGLLQALKTQPNYKIHVGLSCLSLVGGFFFAISYEEWLVILTLITVGLAFETVNTSIEQAADAIDSKWREDIKHTKDLAAGAMLFFAIGSFVIACIIFIPKILLIL